MAEPVESRRILLTTDAVGGVWTYSLDLARGLCEGGAEVVLAVMGPGADDARRAAAAAIAHVNVIETGLPLDWLAGAEDVVLAAGHALSMLADQQRCDLVQLHAPALAAGGDFNVPVVSVHHSCLNTWWAAVRGGQALPEDMHWHSTLVAQGLRRSDAVVAPSTAHAHAIARSYDLAAIPMVIRNGRSGGGNNNCAVSQRPPFILTSGRLWDEGKNAAALDRAAARLEVPVMAAGAVTGPRGESQALPSLRLLGSLDADAMRRLLSQAPVYASTAVYEPFGLGVLEAAQAGCALVLSDIPSFRELWAGACLFVPQHDDEAIATAMSALLADPARLRRLSQRAQHRARLYAHESMAREMARLYSSLMALHRIARGEAA